jgi:phage gpG-like protein
MPFIATDFGPPLQVVGQFNAVEVQLLNFDEAAVELTSLARYIEHAELPLRAVKRIARDDIRERFETETDPDGDGWFDLEPSYAKRKQHEKGFEHPILTRDGELKRKATADSAFVVGGDTLFYDTSELPEYWRVHQEGSVDFGASFHASANPDPNSPTVEGQQNIPPRPYIGMSVKAEAKALELFDIWFSEGIEMATRKFHVGSSGVLHQRIGGRIGPGIDIDNPDFA